LRAGIAMVRRRPIGPTLHRGARLAFTGPYPTTFSGNTGAISHTTFSGGVTNAGTIGAGGISVSSSTFLSGGIVDTGVISGGIRIDSHSRIVASGTTAVALGTRQRSAVTSAMPARYPGLARRRYLLGFRLRACREHARPRA
jgi:hypothetical protein